MINDELGYEAKPGTTATSTIAGKTKKIKRPGRIRNFFRGLVEFWKTRKHLVVFRVDSQPGQFLCIDSNGEIFTNSINCESLLTPPALHTLFVSRHMKKNYDASPMLLGDALFLADVYGELTEETRRRWFVEPTPEPTEPAPTPEEVKGERAK